MKEYLYCVLVTIILLLATVVTYAQNVIYSDGPYVKKTNSGFDVITVVDGKPECERLKDKKLRVLSGNGNHRFDVKLTDNEIPISDYAIADEVTVLSDPHGDIDSFVSILQSSGIINNEYSWCYGNNHLFVLGDVFDRGDEVLPIFWLIYKLSSEAKETGGAVHFLKGNHEDMVLNNDLRYTSSKYTSLADSLNMKYSDFWTNDWVLGEWLSTCNYIERMGKNLFAHAGISEKMISAKLDIKQVNEVMRKYSLSDWESRFNNPEAELLFLMNGPLWYRGMVEPDIEYFDEIDEDGVNKVLEYYNVDRLFVGHTKFEEPISFFDGKIICVNVDNGHNRKLHLSGAVKIKNGILYHQLYNNPNCRILK